MEGKQDHPVMRIGGGGEQGGEGGHSWATL